MGERVAEMRELREIETVGVTWRHSGNSVYGKVSDASSEVPL